MRLEELKQRFNDYQAAAGMEVTFGHGDPAKPFATIRYNGAVEKIWSAKRFVDVCRALELVEWYEPVYGVNVR